jgi:hypothetical protein
MRIHFRDTWSRYARDAEPEVGEGGLGEVLSRLEALERAVAILAQEAIGEEGGEAESQGEPLTATPGESEPEEEDLDQQYTRRLVQQANAHDQLADINSRNKSFWTKQGGEVPDTPRGGYAPKADPGAAPPTRTEEYAGKAFHANGAPESGAPDPLRLSRTDRVLDPGKAWTGTSKPTMDAKVWRARVSAVALP